MVKSQLTFEVSVAKAAMESGVARIALDLDDCKERLQRRMGGGPQSILRRIIQRAKTDPKRIVFPEARHAGESKRGKQSPYLKGA